VTWTDLFFGDDVTASGTSISACRCRTTEWSPIVRKAPFGMRTSLRSILMPALVAASAISAVPIEPKSLPSVPAFDGMTSLNSFKAAARSPAEDRCS